MYFVKEQFLNFIYIYILSTDSSARMVMHGQWKGRVLELLSFGPCSDNPRNIVTQWLIDDGNSVSSSIFILF